LPDKIIGYTAPDGAYATPFKDIFTYAHPKLDYLTVYRATQDKVDDVESIGVPREKIVWGIAIGCNDLGDDVPLSSARDIAKVVKNGGYAGLTTWSLNRDTDHRYRQSDGECNDLQTGESDGSFINAIADELA